MRRWAGRWSRYWFAPASLDRLAICRILAFGWTIVCFLDWRYANFPSAPPPSKFFWEPTLLLRVLDELFGWGPPSVPVRQAVFGIGFAASCAACLGWKTRFTSLLATVTFWYLFSVRAGWFISVRALWPGATFCLMLLFLSLSPCGEALSLDHRFRFSRRLHSGAGWPIKLTAVLVCMVYLSAAWAKWRTSGLSWTNGYTLVYILMQGIDYFKNPLAVYLLPHFNVLRTLSWVVLLFESTFLLVMIYPSLKWLYLPLGLIIHLSIKIFLYPAFSLLCACYIVFVDWDFIRGGYNR